MQFQLEVLSVVGPVKNQKGKNTWNVFEVAYKKEGKIEGKKIVDFNNPNVFEAVGKAKQGEVYTVTAEKINGFWQWTNFERASSGVTEASSASTPSPVESSKGTETSQRASSGSGPGRVTGSNYETSEERARKQRFIIRQSSISNAIQYCDSQKVKGNVDDMLDLAEKFVEFVYKEDAVKGLVEMKDDIPF